MLSTGLYFGITKNSTGRELVDYIHIVAVQNAWNSYFKFAFTVFEKTNLVKNLIVSPFFLTRIILA